MTVSYEQVLKWLKVFAGRVSESREYLTRLDSAIGDADHGINMDRGMKAALAKVDGLADGDIGNLLKTVGMTLVSTVGGAGGPLYGTLFLQLGMKTAGKTQLAAGDWSEALDAAITGVQMRGKAEPGDKTMIDALVPAREALGRALADGASFEEALERSASAAEEGMKSTIPLVARKGRASYLGERSAGHQDPGATSTQMLLQAAADTWVEDGHEG